MRVLAPELVPYQDEPKQLPSGAFGKNALLRLRFEEGLPIREIARRWDSDAARVHKHYARAREAYRRSGLSLIPMTGPTDPRLGQALRITRFFCQACRDG